MRLAPAELGSPLAGAIQRFVAHKRALNRRYDTEEQALRLLDRYLVQRSITDLAGVTPGVLAAFLDSRPRLRQRSYNHLLGAARRLFDWMVEQEMIE
jgi:site-specific recombinase XerD